MNPVVLGALIGGGAALLGGAIAQILGQFLAYHFTNKREFRGKLIETYELVEKSLFYSSPKTVKFLETAELRNLIEETSSKLTLYGKNEALALYGLIGDILSKQDMISQNAQLLEQLSGELIRLMRRDLGISKPRKEYRQTRQVSSPVAPEEVVS